MQCKLILIFFLVQNSLSTWPWSFTKAKQTEKSRKNYKRCGSLKAGSDKSHQANFNLKQARA